MKATTSNYKQLQATLTFIFFSMGCFYINAQKLILLITLTLLSVTVTSAQGKSNNFIEELTEREGELNRGQSQKMAKLKSNKSFDEVRIVKIGNLKALEKRGALPIKMPGVNGAMVAHRTNLEALSENEFQWSGTFKNDEGEVFINATKDGIFGRIIYLDKVYLIEDLGDSKSLLLRYNNEVFTPEECGTPEPDENSKLKEGVRHLKNHCNAMPIRVGVMFTQNAQNTGLNMNNIAQTAINDLNTIITNSGLTSHDARFQLAGVQRMNTFNEGGDICDDATILPANQEARNFRADNLADIVVVMTNAYDPGRLGCAAGIGVADPNAYAIVEAAEANGRFSFGHEVVHLIGGRHQQCELFNPCGRGPNIECGGCDNAPGFNHGWKYRTGVWPFRSEKTTLMHQLQNGWTRQREISNPAVHGRANLNDNARMIENNACAVAGFEPNPMSATISGPTVLNSYQTGNWSVNVQNCNGTTNIRWEYSFNGWSYSFGGTGTSWSFNILGNQRMYIRVRITCSDGQTITLFRTVYQDNNYFIVQNDEKLTKSKSQEKLDSESDLFSNDVKVYPNPATTQINVEFNVVKGKKYTLSLVDLVGRILVEKEIASDANEVYQTKISVPRSTTEMNYLIVSDGDNIRTTKVIIHE